jgi:hypothetical protein
MRKKWGSLPTFNVPTRVDKWTDDTNPYPPFSREEGGWLKTLDEASLEGAIGFDLEFSPSTGKPHLLGIASTKSSACIPWTNGAAEKVVSLAQAKSFPLVGHSVMDADKPVVESACGITTPASLWEDSMIAGYLANQDWCLRGDTLVFLADGTKERIEHLYRIGFSGWVFCVDSYDKRTIGWVKRVVRTPLAQRSLYEVSYTNARGRSIVTGDHQFLTESGWKRADGLIEFDLVNTGTPSYTAKQLAILAGIRFGDSHQALYTTLSWFHITPHKDYVDAKSSAFTNHPLTNVESAKNSKVSINWEDVNRVNLKSTPILKWVLAQNKVDFFAKYAIAESVALWYLDDGCYKNGYPVINCDWLRGCETEQALILAKLHSLGFLDVEFTSYTKGTVLRFLGRDCKDFLYEVTARIAPPSMLYKIPSGNYAETSSWWTDAVPYADNIPCFYDFVQVTKSAPRQLGKHKTFEKSVYCLEVEDHHNFVTSGGVVHNCAQPGKTEDENDKGSLGLMNLWTMASYYTDVPNWKRCRSAACFGPCPDHDEPYYCGIDSWSGLMVYNEAVKSIPRPLYDDLKNLTLYCSDMSRQGIALDRELIARMETQIKEKKAGLFPSEMRLRSERCTKEKRFFLTPFNPNSPAQKLEYFKSVGIPLMGKGRQEKADKDTIRKALEQQLRRLRVTYEVDRKSSQLFISDDDISLPEPVEYLYRLDQYMRSGKGLKSWFDDKYIGDDGFVHPRFIITGTSTGRLASSGPNFQNVPKRGFGALVRAAIVPRSPLLSIGKADKGQLELRIVLFYAGAEQPPNDAFTWLVEKSQGAFKEAASRFAMKERDIAKSLAHAANYLEGLVHLTDDELRTQTRQREIKAGALVVFDDWEYRSGYVGFTGANLAERLFGDRSYEHRKEALALQELYFKAFPSIREWHRKVSREIESTRRITSHTGRSLRLYGSPEDDLKLACAFLGQGGGADEVQEAMLRYQSLGKIALIQVHDELVFELPKEYTDSQVMKFFDVFCEPSAKFGGWRFPIEVSRGDNWCGWDAELNPGGLRVIK